MKLDMVIGSRKISFEFGWRDLLTTTGLIVTVVIFGIMTVISISAALSARGVANKMRSEASAHDLAIRNEISRTASAVSNELAQIRALQADELARIRAAEAEATTRTQTIHNQVLTLLAEVQQERRTLANDRSVVDRLTSVRAKGIYPGCPREDVLLLLGPPSSSYKPQEYDPFKHIQWDYEGGRLRVWFDVSEKVTQFEGNVQELVKERSNR